MNPSFWKRAFWPATPVLGRGRNGWKGMLRFAVAAALVLGLLSAVATKSTTLLQPGGNIALSGSVSGTVAPYSDGELWGGGSRLEACSVCSPSGLLGKSGGRSTDPDEPVDPMMGDFTTSQNLFSVGAVGGDLSMDLTYDSGRAAQQRSTSSPGYFGYGWTSTMSGSVSASGGSVVLNDVNGAQTEFNEDTSADGCPLGDYQDLQKYTVPGSAFAYCAANRVDAQFGYFPSDSAYQLNVAGGQEVDIYSTTFGTLSWVGNDGTTAGNDTTSVTDLNYYYNATPGGPNCPGVGEASCFIETDEADTSRHVIAEVSSVGGVVSTVIDPAGRTYTMSYTDGYFDLNGIVAPAPTTGTGTVATGFTYDTGATNANYKSDLKTITDPNGNATHVAYLNGMVQQTTDASGNVNLYSYSLSDCAVPGSTDCTGDTTQQIATINYADQEIDQDVYFEGQLTNDIWGENDTGAADSEGWSFNYQEPLSTDQDASITRPLYHPPGRSPS